MENSFIVNGVTSNVFWPPGESTIKVTMEVTPTSLKSMLDGWKYQEILRKIEAYVEETLVKDSAVVLKLTDLQHMIVTEKEAVAL